MNFAELVNLCESDNECKLLQPGQYYNVISSSGTIWLERQASIDGEVYVDKNGKIHRLDGPALYRPRNDEDLFIWYKHGRPHRLDGPALYFINKQTKTVEDSEYWINGAEYTKEEFDEFVKNMNKEELDMLGDLGQTFE